MARLFMQEILDFYYTDYMRSITYRAKFVRDGKHIYDAVMFAGNVGVYTAMKPGKFAISENQRDAGSKEGDGG